MTMHRLTSGDRTIAILSGAPSAFADRIAHVLNIDGDHIPGAAAHSRRTAVPDAETISIASPTVS